MNTSEVFHLWASQSRPSAQSGNVRFEGPVLFSYAVPIGYILGDNKVVLSRQRFSNTTSSHQSSAASAVHHMQRVYAPQLPSYETENWAFKHLENDKTWMDTVEVLRNRYLQNKRKRSLLGEIESLLSQRDAYSTFFNLGWTRPSFDDIDKAIEAAAVRAQAVAEQREIQRKLDALAYAKEQEEALADWRNHVVRRYPQFVVTALRLSDDKSFIETSRGASVPVDVAPRLWKAASRQREEGLQHVFGNPYPVGDYRLTRIEADGTLVVGCHTIPFTELEGIAQQLGLLHKEAA